MRLMVLLGGLVLLSGVVQAAEVSAKGLDVSHLSAEQKYVTLKGGTEPPFHNAYWDNHREGIYVDVISGEPLFSSTDKYDSGTGWPSFIKPLKPEVVETVEDKSVGMERTEVRSTKAGAHLGHVFDDGPKDRGGLRYCMNSAALRFVPKEEMVAKGYGKWMYLFEGSKK